MQEATALLITAGAGMSADSGLRTFRDPRGLWTVHDPIRAPGVTPNSFDTDAESSWRFYRDRRREYAKAEPHRGYFLLHEVAVRMRDGYFVYTSNVDEFFQRAGFDPARMVECHGNLSWAHCQERCQDKVWPLPGDEAVRTCPWCGAVARPNVLLFYDFAWISTRMNQQHDAMDRWLMSLPDDKRLVVLELGAGTAVPSVRVCGEDVARRHLGTFIRANLNEPGLDATPGHSLALTASDAIELLAGNGAG